MNVLKSVQLTKQYDDLIAVSNISLELEKGSVLALVGPNGAGKTTWMKMIAGLIPPTSGSVIIDGTSVSENPRTIHNKIGYLPDFFGLYSDLTVYQYLYYFSLCYRVPKDQRQSLIENLISKVNLTQKTHSQIENLSRGMKQRVGLARALISNPPLILLDEPASGLDPDARHELNTLVKDLAKNGHTLIVSSHVLTELEEYSTHVAIIQKGSLIEFSRLDRFKQQDQDKVEVQIEFADPIDGIMQKLKELTSSLGEIQKLDEYWAQIHLSRSRMERQHLLQSLINANLPVCSLLCKEQSISEAYMQAISQKNGESR